MGYGPVGSTMTRLLRENGVEPTVIDLNIETVRRLQAEGVRAIYGDAMHRETLKEAGVEHAVALILTASAMRGREEVIRLARELNRRIRVFAHASYLGEALVLRQSGADAVFSGEGEVALTMTEFILRRLGATAEQIERERERIRTELLVAQSHVEPLVHDEPQPDADHSGRTIRQPANDWRLLILPLVKSLLAGLASAP